MIKGLKTLTLISGCLLTSVCAEEIQDYHLGAKQATHAASTAHGGDLAHASTVAMQTLPTAPSAPARTIVDTDPSSDIGQLIRQLRTEIETARVQRQEDETKSQKLAAELAKVKKTAAVERSKSVKLGKQVATLRSQLKKVKAEKEEVLKASQQASATAETDKTEQKGEPTASRVRSDTIDLFAETPAEATKTAAGPVKEATKKGAKEAPKTEKKEETKASAEGHGTQAHASAAH